MYGEFANGETLAIFEKKLLPVLEELARAEFAPICFDGDVDAECAECMRNSIEIVVGAINVYLRGLMELYTRYGRYVTEISLRSQSQSEPTPEQAGDADKPQGEDFIAWAMRPCMCREEYLRKAKEAGLCKKSKTLPMLSLGDKIYFMLYTLMFMVVPWLMVYVCKLVGLVH